jgi:Ca2+-binding RTX toxin-like protein
MTVFARTVEPAFDWDRVGIVADEIPQQETLSLTTDSPQSAAGSVTITGNSTSDVIFSPDGLYLYASSGGAVSVYSSASGQLLTSWTIGSQLGAMDLSADGRYLVATERTPGPSTGTQWSTQTDYYVYRLDTVTGGVQTYTSHATGYDGAYHDVSFLANGQILLTQNFLGSGWEPLTTLDPTTGMFTRGSATYAQDGTLSTTPDDRFVAFTPHNISDAPIFYYRSGTGVTASHQGYQDNVSGYNGGLQAISPNGSLVVEGVGFNVYNSSLQLQFSLATLYPELGATGMAFSPDGGTFYMLNSAMNTIFALSTADWALTAGYQTHVTLGQVNTYGDTLTASQNGRYLSVMGSNGVEVIDLTQAPSAPGTPGADVLTNAGSGNVYGFGGNDTITVTAAVSVVRAGAGDDRVTITPSSGYGSYQLIEGGTGDDTLDLSAIAAPTFTSVATGFRVNVGSNQTFTATGFEHVQLGAGANVFTMSNSDLSTLDVRAGAGNDTLQGGPRMTLRGEAGNDVFYLAAGGATATTGVIDGGADQDRVELSAGFAVDLLAGTASSGLAQYNLSGIEDVRVTLAGIASTASGDDNANAMSVNSYRDDGTAGVTFYGRGGDDQLTGSAGADVIYGGDGADLISGGSGGIDHLYGDAGNDRIIAANGVYVDGGVDSDTMVVTDAVWLGGLSAIEAIEFQGGGALTLSASQFTAGLAPNATLSGTGSLTINMAAGDSELYLQQLVGGSGVTITVNGSANNDLIKGAVNAVNIINGGEGSDAIRGGQLIDTLNGGNGNDKIEGGMGADILTGGAGADTFRYQSASASTVAAPDRITDFVSGTDKLGFLLLDSDPTTPGIQGFSYIDTQAFHHTGAAEIRYETTGADLTVQADLNGDGIADMAMILQGLGGGSLGSADFLI